jgi:hypothetical protein
MNIFESYAASYATHAREEMSLQDYLMRWIPSRSATVSSKPDLNVFSKLGKHGLDGCFEGEAFSRG